MATTKDLIQLAYEESPRYEGAPTATPYRISTDLRYMAIQSARIDPGVQHLDRSDEVRGIEGSLSRLIETYEPAGSIAVRGYINDLIFLLNATGFTGAHTTGDGVITDPDAAVIPTGAHRWVYTKRGGITAKTMQLILAYVNEGVFLKGQGFGVSQLNLNAAGLVTGDLMGLYMANVADPNLTPAIDAGTILPVRRGDLTLTWLASSGTTDDFTISVANPLVRRRTLGLATPSFFPDVMEHGDDRVYVTGTIPKSRLADADVDALLAATTFSAKARWKTTKVIGATAYTYSMWLEMPSCQLVDGNADELTNRRRRGGTFSWFAAWDEAAGYDAKFTLVGSVPSIETYV